MKINLEIPSLLKKNSVFFRELTLHMSFIPFEWIYNQVPLCCLFHFQKKELIVFGFVPSHRTGRGGKKASFLACGQRTLSNSHLGAPLQPLSWPPPVFSRFVFLIQNFSFSYLDDQAKREILTPNNIQISWTFYVLLESFIQGASTSIPQITITMVPETSVENSGLQDTILFLNSHCKGLPLVWWVPPIPGSSSVSLLYFTCHHLQVPRQDHLASRFSAFAYAVPPAWNAFPCLSSEVDTAYSVKCPQVPRADRDIPALMLQQLSACPLWVCPLRL